MSKPLVIRNAQLEVLRRHLQAPYWRGVQQEFLAYCQEKCVPFPSQVAEAIVADIRDAGYSRRGEVLELARLRLEEMMKTHWGQP